MSAHSEAWALVETAPEVIAARRALDEHDAQEEKLSSQLGRAIRRAHASAEEHLAYCDPWKEKCSRCGREPAAGR